MTSNENTITIESPLLFQIRQVLYKYLAYIIIACKSDIVQSKFSAYIIHHIICKFSKLIFIGKLIFAYIFTKIILGTSIHFWYLIMVTPFLKIDKRIILFLSTNLVYEAPTNMGLGENKYTHPYLPQQTECSFP